MANNYLQFSETLRLENKEQVDWAQDRLTFLSKSVKALDLSQEEIDRLEDAGYDVEPEFYIPLIDFDWDIASDPSGHYVFFYAGESGDPGHVAAFVQEYLTKFKPDGIFGLTWATWCSKPRPGEFSGGGMVVTAEKIEVFDAVTWVEMQMRKNKTRV